MIKETTIDMLIELKFPIKRTITADFGGEPYKVAIIREHFIFLKFEEIWHELPKFLVINGKMCILDMNKVMIGYSDGNDYTDYIVAIKDGNITEAAALLWEKLKKGGYL